MKDREELGNYFYGFAGDFRGRRLQQLQKCPGEKRPQTSDPATKFLLFPDLMSACLFFFSFRMKLKFSGLKIPNGQKTDKKAQEIFSDSVSHWTNIKFLYCCLEMVYAQVRA